jgi:hypothetical protein
MKHILKKLLYGFIFISIVGIACVFRFTGIHWDSGAHLHPDERFLTMVDTDMSWPTSLAQYFDTDTSPLNPHNTGHAFYVYGTWPVILTKTVATAFHMDTYDGVLIVGRIMSGIFDMLTLILVFLITRYITSLVPDSRFSFLMSLLASFLYAISVLPIQLSHFFAVDTFTVCAMTLVIYMLIRKQFSVGLGVALGIALGAKISSILLMPVIGISYLTVFPWRGTSAHIWKKRGLLVLAGCIMIASTFFTLRIVYPYLFSGIGLNPKLLQNWIELKGFDGDNTGFPPALQWIGTIPLFNPLYDIVMWGLGLPLGIIAICALMYFIIKIYIHGISHIRRGKFLRVSSWPWLQDAMEQYRLDPDDAGHKIQRAEILSMHHICILLVWIFTVFVYQGMQFAKPLRYMAPLYPALCVLTALFLSNVYIAMKKHVPHLFICLFAYLFICLFLVWPISFMSIYTRPTTRIAASQWIYDTIPAGQTLTWEQWDDPLPLGLSNNSITQYKTLSLSLYDPDAPENIVPKWQKLTGFLSQTDYLILSSDRVYGGTQQAKKRLPITAAYYQLLFNGKLGFTKIHEFSSRPTLPLPWFHLCITPPGARYGTVAYGSVDCTTQGISIVDDFAEESYTVYDHPKVIIFQNTKHLTQDQLFTLITKN